jgi:hypothetical protein
MAHGYLYNAGGWTIEIWFWRDAPPVSGHACLFAQYTQISNIIWAQGGEVGRQLWVGFTPTTGAFHVQGGDEGGGNSFTWTDPSPSGYEGDSSWHHLAVTLDAATRKSVKVYLDGELYATAGTLASPLVWNAGILNVAGAMHSHHGNRGNYAFDKRVAYFAAFNRELTANRVLEHYTAGNGGTVYYGDDEIERLTRIYDWAGVPLHARLSEPATTVLQGIQVAGSNALSQAQDTVNSAGGYIFADGQAALHYHNKQHRYNKLAKMVLSEASQSAPEVGITFTTNHEYIYNDIHGDRPFGSRVRLMNQISHDTYGHKVFEFTLKVTDPDELTNAVTWILARYGEDRVRVKGVSFECTTSHVLKELAYGRVEIGDKLTLDELPDVSPYSTMDFIVESISVNANFLNKTWIVELELSPDDVNQVFQIGKSALGGSDYVAF